jgi:hypothetical protein
MMLTQHPCEKADSLPKSTVMSVVEQILLTGQVTRADANGLLQAGMSLETPFTSEEQAKIRAVFYRLRLGMLRVL